MDINTWFERHKDDEYVGDAETARILEEKTDSTAAAQLWSAIAAGKAEVADTLMWAKKVAARITAELIETRGQQSSYRERAALRAIGFNGPVDDYREAKEYMRLISQFHPLDERGEEMPNEHLTAKQWHAVLRGAGHLARIDDKTAQNKINEWRKELNIE